MDWQRTLLLGAMAAVTFMLFLEWNEFQERRHPPAVESSATLPSTTAPRTTAPAEESLPALPPEPGSGTGEDIPSSPHQESKKPTAANAQLVAVKTDTMDVLIDTLGGDIAKVGLPKHAASLEHPEIPYELLNRTENHIYIAQSGLIGPNGTDSAKGRPVFNVSQNSFQLAEGQETLTVDFTLVQGEVQITKRFTFHRGDYLIQIDYLIDNQSAEAWKANMFGQIKRDDYVPPVNAGIGVQPFLGAAITTPDENYKKYDFDDLRDASVKIEKEGGWVAMVQHYFLSAWIPPQESENTFTLRQGKVHGEEVFLLGFTTPPVVVPPSEQAVIKASFYAGPKDIYRLEEISPYLDLTVDYGWLWWIAKPLFHFLTWIYNLLGNWGWSIVVLTIIVKAIFFPLSATSYKSMAKMRKVQPLMMELKERYGDNRQKMSEELMKLYRKEKVNPLSGCLPILVQMPVFIALYWVLLESVELRHTPFLGWIDDLSVKDPYFVLPLIMGVTMFIQQKLNPAPPDPTQARIMQMMPIVFTFMFMWFPAGLVLYWVVNNTLSIGQQYIITRQIEASDK